MMTMATMLKILTVTFAVVALSDGQNYCTVSSGPHVHPFQGGPYSLLLPCAHKIADLVTPGNCGSCRLQINGRAEYLHPYGSNGIFFEKLIHIRVTWDHDMFTLIFDGNKHPVTGYSGPHQTLRAAGITIEKLTNTRGCYYIVTIEHCRIKLIFKPYISCFTLITEAGAEHNEGLCGDCSRTWADYVDPKGQKILKKILDYQHPLSPIDNSKMNIYPVCDDLSHILHHCPRKHLAVQYCGPLLTDSKVRQCLYPKLNGNLGYLNNFKECVNAVCKNLTRRKCYFKFGCYFKHCDPPNHVRNYCNRH